MIHIYDAKGNFKDSLNYTKEEFVPEWYGNFAEGDIVSEVKFEYPVSYSGGIREMTKEEKVAAGIDVTLAEGEIIEDKKIKKIEKPQNLIKPVWDNNTWIEGYTTQEYHSDIDRAKAEVLSEGYTWKEHRQKCRDKDIGLMTATIESLRDYKELNKKDITIVWYFEDNDGVELGIDGMKELRLAGLTFIQKVYTVENVLKTGALGVITKDKYLKLLKEV